MEDQQIVALYWERDERAIRETDRQYGRYLFQIAYQILREREDSRESVNDTYLRAWTSIPPARPAALGLYLGKIIRHLSIDRFRSRNRKKRGAGEYVQSLEELEECISGGNTTEQYADVRALAEMLNRFLKEMKPEARGVFISRYYYMDSVRETAFYYGISEAKVKSMLQRMRIRLKAYLREAGFEQGKVEEIQDLRVLLEAVGAQGTPAVLLANYTALYELRRRM